jgi:hypothetical protein
MIVDYARVRDAFDIERPPSDSDEEELQEYANQLLFTEAGGRGINNSGVLATVLFPLGLEEVRDSFGFTIVDADQSIELGLRGESWQAVRGRFDQQVIIDALHNDSDFNESLQDLTHNGFDYFAWAGGPATEGSSCGRGTIAAEGDFVYWASTEEQMRQMIDSVTNKAMSAADMAAIRTSMEAVESQDAYAAMTTNLRTPVSAAARMRAGVDAPPELIADLEDELRQQPLLAPYRFITTGLGHDEGGYFTVVVLTHEDAAAATENARRLEQRLASSAASAEGERWGDVFEDVNVASEGPLVIAKLYTDRTGLWNRLALSFDTLLVFDDDSLE